MVLNKILGMNFHSISQTNLIKNLDNEIYLNNKNQYISITNTEALYFGDHNKDHFNYINGAYLSLCDGIGVKIGAFFKSKKVVRYNGPKLFEDVINHGQKFGWTHYFLGGKKEVINNLKTKTLIKYPEAKIFGLYSPPFRELNNNEIAEMIENINSKKPNFLWIGLGLPKQEQWIMKFINKIDVNFAIGVGAVFDTQTDNITRAPAFLQRIGLEWLFRVFGEPRMIPRIIRSFKIMFKIIFTKK